MSDTTTPVTAVADMFIVCSPVDSDDTLLTYGNTPEWNNCHIGIVSAKRDLTHIFFQDFKGFDILEV